MVDRGEVTGRLANHGSELGRRIAAQIPYRPRAKELHDFQALTVATVSAGVIGLRLLSLRDRPNRNIAVEPPTRIGGKRGVAHRRGVREQRTANFRHAAEGRPTENRHAFSYRCGNDLGCVARGPLGARRERHGQSRSCGERCSRPRTRALVRRNERRTQSRDARQFRGAVLWQLIWSCVSSKRQSTGRGTKAGSQGAAVAILSF